MLLKRPTLFASLTIALLASLSACAGSNIGKNVEQSLAPDPRFPQPSSNNFSEPQPPPGGEAIPRQPSPIVVVSPPIEPVEEEPPEKEPSEESPESSESPSPSPSPDTSEFPSPSPESESSPTPEPSPRGTIPPDLLELGKEPQEVPEGLRPYVEDMSKLGALKPPEDEKGAKSLSVPNQHVSRRDFARWLVEVNNRMHANEPGMLIHRAALTDEPAFEDVPNTDPDFPYIQALAEAGVVSSPLSGDTNNINFGPDEPLTRQEMILWKVHLDTRDPLPKTTVENVNEAWGFRDGSKIDAEPLRAVMVDFSNGDFSNIRRVFGYTTLFHPKFPVTRAEAAASLWYFGFQGDGVSAEELLKGSSQ